MIDKKINVWEYSRYLYLLGRTVKFKSFSEFERNAIIQFIINDYDYRKQVYYRVNLKKGNGLCEYLNCQNDFSLGKILQVLGRTIKQQPVFEGEKVLFEELFSKTDPRRFQKYNGFNETELEDVKVKYVGVLSESEKKDLNLTDDDVFENISDAISQLEENTEIFIKAGDYDSNITINKKGIKIIGVGEVNLNGKIELSGDDVSGFELKNVTVNVSDDREIENLPVEGAIDFKTIANDIVLDSVNVIVDGAICGVCFAKTSENIIIKNSNITGGIFNVEGKEGKSTASIIFQSSKSDAPSLKNAIIENNQLFGAIYMNSGAENVSIINNNLVAPKGSSISFAYKVSGENIISRNNIGDELTNNGVKFNGMDTYSTETSFDEDAKLTIENNNFTVVSSVVYIEDFKKIKKNQLVLNNNKYNLLKDAVVINNQSENAEI